MFAVLLLSGSALYGMEERDSPLTAPSDGSSTPTSFVPLNPAQKKQVSFSSGTSEYTNVPLAPSSRESKKAYRKEQADIEKEQITGQQKELNELSPEQALGDLLAFAKTAIPDVQNMIDSCANDILEIWKFFSIVPTDEAMAKQNFSKLNLATKDYQAILIPIQHRSTGTQSDSIIDEYEDKLLTLIGLALYKPNSNPDVEKLNDLISNFKKSMQEKAKQLYIEFKKPELDRIFSKIPQGDIIKNQYIEALSCGQEFIDTTKNTETAVEAAMHRYPIYKRYSQFNYNIYLYAKQQIDKEMAINGVWPYAEKMSVKKETLDLMF